MTSTSYNQNDVEEALAEASAVRQTAEEKDEDAASWCQNPYCRKVLLTSYARYCGRSVCQLHRGLKLQCQANAETAVLEERKSQGRSDLFLVLGASARASDDSREKKTDEVFVIPRRKRPGTSSTAAVHRSRSGGAVEAESTRSSCRKRLRLGQRMQFNEVLSYFEPRAPTIPAVAVFSQLPQVSHWSRAARIARPPPRSSRARTSEDDAQSNMRASLQAMGRLPIVSRRASRPRPIMYATTRARAASSRAGRLVEPQDSPSRRTYAAPTSLVWPNQHSTFDEHDEQSRPLWEYTQPRYSNNARRLNPELPRLNHEFRRTEYERVIDDFENLDEQKSNATSDTRVMVYSSPSQGIGQSDARPPRCRDKDNTEGIHFEGDTDDRTHQPEETHSRTSLHSCC
ncbi:hypothetical protein GN244_ATG14562 [Phytophthora infestans]|uniref:Uncharacterized protein n=1 Tax=Phytophthora infestans TaxID=4787 RepID=A0A833WQ27_PHYIN|nr:hypothetical protein GN244_ATG14562 [Phytophthora infestans]KAF4147112.1 hypothetical protein GN958_ATG03741 [Phytophthora infestans]